MEISKNRRQIIKTTINTNDKNIDQLKRPQKTSINHQTHHSYPIYDPNFIYPQSNRKSNNFLPIQEQNPEIIIKTLIEELQKMRKQLSEKNKIIKTINKELQLKKIELKIIMDKFMDTKQLLRLADIKLNKFKGKQQLILSNIAPIIPISPLQFTRFEDSTIQYGYITGKSLENYPSEPPKSLWEQNERLEMQLQKCLQIIDEFALNYTII